MSVRIEAPRTTRRARPAGRRPAPMPVVEDFAPAPSPDGTRVAYLSDRAGTPGVWIRQVGADDAVA
ncbi:hypothetical protein, partial [Micromonospora chokoriensis]